MEKQKREDVIKALVAIYMIVYVLITIFTIRDYGWSHDDGIQRFHSLVSYKYVNEIVFNRDLNDRSVFENVPDIDVYDYKYYGIALQLPFVFVEDLFHFKLPMRDIFIIRHVGIALICCLGYFFFYKFISGITNNRFYGFIGMLLMSLYPRFYGEKFFNVKDQVFVATCCLAYWGIYFYLSHERKVRYGVLAGGIFAVSTCSRMMGVMFPAILIAYMIVYDIKEKMFASRKEVLNRFIEYFSILVPYFLIWYIGTPAVWFKNVFKEFYKAFTFFSYYDVWDGTSVFAGEALHFTQMPWYYIFVWIGITVPFVYITLFLIGHGCIYKKDRSLAQWFDRMMTEDKYVSLAVIMFWGPCILVALHVVKIYTAWRHMFFLMCPFVMLAVFGLRLLLEAGWGKKYAAIVRRVCVILFVVSMIFQIAWMVRNHPYQYVYFNILGRPMASQYDRDYFRGTAYDLLQYILETDSREKITISRYSDIDMEFVYLSDEDKARLDSVRGDGDYIVLCYRNIVGNDYCPEGYHEVYSIIVDGTKMGTVFKADV